MPIILKFLELIRGRFQVFMSNFSKSVRLLSFMPLWHVFYATIGGNLRQQHNMVNKSVKLWSIIINPQTVGEIIFKS